MDNLARPAISEPSETLQTLQIEAAAAGKRPIDVERLLHWAFAEQRVGAGWRESPELAYDRGVTARPRRRPKVGFATATACAGARSDPRPARRLAVDPHPDAVAVYEAVQRLPARSRSLIRLHARLRSRPGCFAGVTPILRPVWRDEVRRIPMIRGKDRNRHYGYCPLEWSVDPEAIRQARADYAAWHAGLMALSAGMLCGLARWEISGFRAPAEPWRQQA